MESKQMSNLYGQIKSIRAISKQTGLSRGTVRRILVKAGMDILTNDEAIIIANRKNPRKYFDGNEQTKAYLYGFVLGDVHVFRRSKFTLRAITCTTRKSFVNLFNSEFSRYGKVNCKLTKNFEWRLFIDLDYNSFRFLEDRKIKGLPPWINNKNFLFFFAGLIDSDGSVLIRKAGRYFQYVVKVFGQDLYLLNTIAENLQKIDFKSCLSRIFVAGRQRIWRNKKMIYNKDYYSLEIYRKEDTLKLLRVLNLKHKEKIARKQQILEINTKKPIFWNDIKEDVTKLRKRIKEEA